MNALSLTVAALGIISIGNVFVAVLLAWWRRRRAVVVEVRNSDGTILQVTAKEFEHSTRLQGLVSEIRAAHNELTSSDRG